MAVAVNRKTNISY